MSVRLWGYEAEKCDGFYCPNNCDRCYKAEMTAEDFKPEALEYKSEDTAKPTEDCPYPKCEDCDKYHGHYCTVPMVISKQIYRLTEEKIKVLEKSIAEIESLVTDEILGSKE